LEQERRRRSCVEPFYSQHNDILFSLDLRTCPTVAETSSSRIAGYVHVREYPSQRPNCRKFLARESKEIWKICFRP